MTSRDRTVHYVTEDGVKKLEKELVHLRNVRRQEVASRIHEAVDSGGGTDNADFEGAKNEQAFVEGRNGKPHRCQIVGSVEAAPLENKISNESPLGQALVGHKKGDKIDYETPSGHQNLTIKKIQ